MCGISNEAKITTRMKIRLLLQEQDCSIKELMAETGLAHATITRRMASWVKSGDVEIVQATRHKYCKNTGAVNGVIAARFAWANREQKYNDQAEALIYRLLDRLMDTPLDAGGQELVKEAQQFINWTMPNE